MPGHSVVTTTTRSAQHYDALTWRAPERRLQDRVICRRVASGLRLAPSRNRTSDTGHLRPTPGRPTPKSDVELLVEFEPGQKVNLFDMARMEIELAHGWRSEPPLPRSCRRRGTARL
jgi:hypothetical protein